jgi:hypothetical protein
MQIKALGRMMPLIRLQVHYLRYQGIAVLLGVVTVYDVFEADEADGLYCQRQIQGETNISHLETIIAKIYDYFQTHRKIVSQLKPH